MDVVPLRKLAVHISTVRTESIFAIYEAEFYLHLIVGFVAKDVIMNHGVLLKIYEGRLEIMSFIN
jgi:hypothetical protein